VNDDDENNALYEASPAFLGVGHRERLRERARGSDFAGLPDYELLELFLFRSIPSAM